LTSAETASVKFTSTMTWKQASADSYFIEQVFRIRLPWQYPSRQQFSVI